MNKRHYEHTLPNIRGSLSNTYVVGEHGKLFFFTERRVNSKRPFDWFLNSPFMNGSELFLRQ